MLFWKFLGLPQSGPKAGWVQSILAVTPPLVPLFSHEIRCRQFVEMVNGTDSEVRCFSTRSPRSQDSYPGSPSLSPRHGSSNSHVHSTGKCVLCLQMRRAHVKGGWNYLLLSVCLFSKMLLFLSFPSWGDVLLPWVSLPFNRIGFALVIFHSCLESRFISE